MRRSAFFLFVILNLVFSETSSIHSTTSASAEANTRANAKSYLGFDLNTYPGDDALPILRKSFSFVGYWLGLPPGGRENTWMGKRELFRSQGFGFALLYAGPQSNALKSQIEAKQKGMSDAKDAAGAAKKEGFPAHSVIFLDIEEGGRLPQSYHAYLREWADELGRTGYRAGVYCSGMPVNEGGGVTIITAEDIRNNLVGREIVYWVFNDACPPSPGCVVRRNPPSPRASRVPYAAIWQYTRSPRKEFTGRCASTYQSDGNCYAAGDTSQIWFLDLDIATSPDPSAGGN